MFSATCDWWMDTDGLCDFKKVFSIVDVGQTAFFSKLDIFLPKSHVLVPFSQTFLGFFFIFFQTDHNKI